MQANPRAIALPPRYREGDPEPEGVPAPTQLRADFIKVKSLYDPDATYAPPQVKDVPLVYGPGAGGAATVGDTLTCTMGNWTGVPSVYEYQWQRDGTASGAAGPSSTYTVVADDVGHAMTCVVTAANSEGATAAPPSNAVTIA